MGASSEIRQKQGGRCHQQDSSDYQIVCRDKSAFARFLLDRQDPAKLEAETLRQFRLLKARHASSRHWFKFVLPDLECKHSLVVFSRHTSTDNQQHGKSLLIQLYRPFNSHFEARSDAQLVIRRKEYPGAADVERLPASGKDLQAAVKRSVLKLSLNGKAR